MFLPVYTTLLSYILLIFPMSLMCKTAYNRSLDICIRVQCQIPNCIQYTKTILGYTDRKENFFVKQSRDTVPLSNIYHPILLKICFENLNRKEVRSSRCVNIDILSVNHVIPSITSVKFFLTKQTRKKCYTAELDNYWYII